MHHLTQLHLITLVARWRQDLARNTTYGRVIALRRCVRFYEDTTGVRGLRSNVPKVPGVQPRQTIATPQEIEALRNAADPLMRVWLRIAVALALGQAEVLSLAPCHYNAEKKTVSFIRKKTGHHQTLPVPDDLAAIFEAAPDFGDPSLPFVALYNRGQRLSTHAARDRWNRLKKRAGVRAELIPHDLRRTTATALQLLTHDITAVQALLGHQTLAAAAHYVSRADPETLRPLLAQLWTPKTEVKQ